MVRVMLRDQVRVNLWLELGLAFKVRMRVKFSFRVTVRGG